MPASRRWTLVATILGSSMTFIDATVVNVALPALQADLQATITDVQWVIEAYALVPRRADSRRRIARRSVRSQAGVSLRRGVLHGGLDLCGVATSPGHAHRRRALQGIGAAFLVPGSLAIISATFDARSADERSAPGRDSARSRRRSDRSAAAGWSNTSAGARCSFSTCRSPSSCSSLSLRFMEREPRPVAHGADRLGRRGARASLGLGGVVFGLLEWPPLGARPSAGARSAGDRRRARSWLLFVVERRVPESDVAA